MPVDVKTMRKSARQVSKFLDKNPRTPSSGAIHKLRTSARSLETTFVALELDGKRVKRLLSDLGKIRKIAGRVRDTDVWTENVIKVEQPGEQDCLVRLLEHLTARRTKGARKLRRLIRATRPRLRRNVKRTFRRAEKLLTRSATDPARDDAVAAATARAIRFSTELRRQHRLTKSNLHEHRLKLKEFRDILRLSDRSGSSALLKDLGEVKDAIGEWHDWVELSSLAKPLLDHGPSCKLMQRLRAVGDAKYKKALSLAHGFARRYLESTPRKGHRGRGKGRPAPALEAASEIAEP